MIRVVPLLGARRLPDQLGRLAGWAGVSVLATFTVRAVLLHEDSSAPWPVVRAAVAVAVALVLAFRGRSTVLAVGTGAATYVVLSAVMAQLG